MPLLLVKQTLKLGAINLPVERTLFVLSARFVE